MKRKRVVERSEKSRKHILDVLEILRFALNDKPCQYIVSLLYPLQELTDILFQLLIHGRILESRLLLQHHIHRK